MRDNLFAPVPPWLSMPFHYGTLSFIRIYFPMDPERARAAVPDLRPLVHRRQAFASLDFQLYTSHAEGFLARTAEVELCLLGAPAKAPEVELSLADYLLGEDQTRTLGLYRLHVPCDNDFAVRAGIALFGEHKYAASFSWAVPTPNAPQILTISYGCRDPSGREVFRVSADLSALRSRRAPGGALVRYAHLNGRLAGSRTDLFGDLDTFLDLPKGAVEVHLGDGDLPIRTDLPWTTLAAPAIAAQTFTHRSAAVEGRGYYVEP